MELDANLGGRLQRRDQPTYEQLLARVRAEFDEMPCSRLGSYPTRSYRNAPFVLILTQTDATLRGSYSDQHDTSVSVNGTVNQSSITIAVDFGDGQLHFEGTVETVRRVTGTMRTSALGNTYPFTMTR